MQISHPRFSGDVVFAQYGNGETAILIEDGGEQVAVATVNLDGMPNVPALADDQVWIKTWAENEGIDNALARAGVIALEPILYVVNRFGSVAVMARLTQVALAERATQRGDG